MTRCPTRGELQQFLAEQLPGPGAETIEAHLESCQNCQQVLEELTANADLRAGRLPAPGGVKGGPTRLTSPPAAAPGSPADTLDDPGPAGPPGAQGPESRGDYTITHLH